MDPVIDQIRKDMQAWLGELPTEIAKRTPAKSSR